MRINLEVTKSGVKGFRRLPMNKMMRELKTLLVKWKGLQAMCGWIDLRMDSEGASLSPTPRQ
jgi:hypothetical protein